MSREHCIDAVTIGPTHYITNILVIWQSLGKSCKNHILKILVKHQKQKKGQQLIEMHTFVHSETQR